MKMIYRLLLISFLGSSVYAKVNLNTTDASDKKDDEIFYENVLLPRELNEWLKEDDSLKTVINDSANREGNYQSNEALSINDSVSLSVKSLKQLKTILHIPGDRKSAWYAAGALKAWSEIGWWPDSIVGEAWSLPLGWLKNNYVHFDDYLVLSTNLKALTKNKKEVWPFSHYGSLLGSSLYYTNNEWQANPAKEDSLGPKLFQEILFFHLKSFSQQRPVSEIEIASVVNQIKYNQVDSLIEKLEWPNIFNHLVIVPEGKRQEFSNSNNNLALYLPVELTTDSIGFLKGYEWGRRQAKNIFRYINYDPENNAKPLPATHVDKQNFAGFNFEQNSKIQESFWHKLFLNSKLDSTDKEIDFKYLIHQWNHEDRKSYLPNAQLSLNYQDSLLYLNPISYPLEELEIDAGVKGGLYTGALGAIKISWNTYNAFNLKLYSELSLNQRFQELKLGFELEGLSSPFLTLNSEFKKSKSNFYDHNNLSEIDKIDGQEFLISAKWIKGSKYISQSINYNRNEYLTESYLDLVDDTLQRILVKNVPVNGISLKGDYGFKNNEDYMLSDYYALLFKTEIRSIALKEFSEKGSPLNASLGFELNGNTIFINPFFLGLGFNYQQDFSAKSLMEGSFENPESFDDGIFRYSNPLLNLAFAKPFYQSFRSQYEPNLEYRSYGFHNYTIRLGADLNEYFQSLISIHFVNTHFSPAKFGKNFYNIIEWRNRVKYKSLLLNTYAESVAKSGDDLNWTFGFNIGLPLSFY